MASNVSVSTVARLVVPHKVPIRSSCFDLLQPCLAVSCLSFIVPMRMIHVKVGKGSRGQKRNIVPVHDRHTDTQTDKISTFITRKGLASLAPINCLLKINI